MSTSVAIDLLTYLHILSAMGWLGGSLLFLMVIGPILPSLKPATSRDLVLNLFPRFARTMTVFGFATILFGAGLLSATIAGDTSQLAFSNPWGLWITVGALIALVAAFEGGVIMRGYVNRMVTMTRAAPEVPAGPPPAEFLALQRHIRIASISNTLLLLAALGFMVAAAGA